MIKSCVVSIGNSDDKLTQKEWISFCESVDYFIRLYANQVHFYGHGLPNRIWQNACWIFELKEAEWEEPKLKFELEQLTEKYKQDSIFWQSGKAEFIC